MSKAREMRELAELVRDSNPYYDKVIKTIESAAKASIHPTLTNETYIKVDWSHAHE